jgi:hypothetical protein
MCASSACPRKGVIARQFMLGVVQTADGMPIYHEVFDGNTAEAPTLKPTLEGAGSATAHVAAWWWWPTAGCCRWTTSRMLSELKVPDGQPLEFILAVPGRRYADFVELLQPLAKAAQAPRTRSSPRRWQGHRLVVAHNPVRAARADPQRRREASQALQAACRGSWPASSTRRTPARSSAAASSPTAAPRRASSTRCAMRSLARIIKVDLKSDLFTYDHR